MLFQYNFFMIFYKIHMQLKNIQIKISFHFRRSTVTRIFIIDLTKVSKLGEIFYKMNSFHKIKRAKRTLYHNFTSFLY